MLTLVIVLFQRVEDDLEMRLVAQEVGIADVYEKGADIVLTDIVRIGFLDIVQVLIRDMLFIAAVAFSDIGLELAHGSMKIDQNIRLDHLRVDNVE
jgi:hypothetical protein